MASRRKSVFPRCLPPFGVTCCTVLLAAATGTAAAEGRLRVAELAEALRTLPSGALPDELREGAGEMLSKDLDERLRAANRRSTAEWRAVQTRQDWERLRDEKLRRLREAIGPFPEVPASLDLHVTGAADGEGFRVENLVYQTRPGLWVTANLYLPAEPGAAMPGLLICHSHHTPKEHGELQDMGMTWARRGCLVLVPDLLGHGERRQHPFVTAEDYPKPFRVGRQDYYFRYDLGIQLHLAGETLMGWFVWDLWRSVDVLLAQDGVDPERIILLGAVAGGGDPAAVAAALNPRVRAAVPMNFGGAEPESPYPLPEDAETSFDYAGRGSFESTRNLRRSAAEGFLPWVIVGSVAPRPLVYAHEFAWDEPRDPVWKRLRAIWGFYEAEDKLAAAHGRGSVRGRPPGSTHCTHIGRKHRESIHPLFRRWFDIHVGEEDEYSARLEPARLRAMTPEAAGQLGPRRLCDLLPGIAAGRLAAAAERRAGLSAIARRERLREELAAVLGPVRPASPPKVRAFTRNNGLLRGVGVERIVMEVEPGIVVPVLLLVPRKPGGERLPVVVAVAQAGKARFLVDRAETVAGLLAGGAAVCMPDLRGLGETKPEGSRERWGAITGQSSTELMLGGTMVGSRLRDLRSVLAYLRGRSDVDSGRIALWGDSFAEANPPDRDFHVPRNVDDRPRRSEPLGGLVALLGALDEDDVCGVYVHGGLSDFGSVLAHQFVYVPHDAVVPGLLSVVDLPELAAALAPRPLRLGGLVDAMNRRLPAPEARERYQPATQAYHGAGCDDRLVIHGGSTPASTWLLETLRRE